MTNVKLIEAVRSLNNYHEVIATVQNNEKEYLGITEFVLSSNQNLPENEDELSSFLEQLDLTWDLYIPNFVA